VERVYFDERIAECYGAGSAELFETDAIGPTVSPLAELAAVAFTEADGNDARAPLLTDRAVRGAPLLVLGQPVPALNHGLDWEANDPKGLSRDCWTFLRWQLALVGLFALVSPTEGSAREA
jgi:hypothetical protein